MHTVAVLHYATDDPCSPQEQLILRVLIDGPHRSFLFQCHLLSGFLFAGSDTEAILLCEACQVKWDMTVSVLSHALPTANSQAGFNMPIMQTILF